MEDQNFECDAGIFYVASKVVEGAVDLIMKVGQGGKGLPLIAIAIIAIVGVVINKQLTGKKEPPNGENSPPGYYEDHIEQHVFRHQGLRGSTNKRKLKV